jgi:hypothetical protein
MALSGYGIDHRVRDRVGHSVASHTSALPSFSPQKGHVRAPPPVITWWKRRTRWKAAKSASLPTQASVHDVDLMRLLLLADAPAARRLDRHSARGRQPR